jgi:O-antigen ligase
MRFDLFSPLKNIFANTRRFNLLIIAIAALVSLVLFMSTGASFVELALLPFVAWLGYLLFVKYLQVGLYIFLVELILGGNGRWLPLFGGEITLRYVLILAILGGYLLRKLVKGNAIPKLLATEPVVLFVIVIIFGIVQALWNGNPQAFQDAQVWLYLVLAFVIVDLWKNEGVPRSFLQLFLWLIFILAIIQLLLLLAVNLDPVTVYANYRPLERMRILISPLFGTPIYYVFMGNSSLYGYLLAVSVLLAVTRKQQNAFLPVPLLWVMGGMALLASMFSMTRGTWGQISITLLLLSIHLFIRKKLSIKVVTPAVLLAAISITVIFVNPVWRDAFFLRAETLLPSRRLLLEPGDSVVLKSLEAKQQISAIAARPIAGYGFGVGDYAGFGETLVNTLYFHNSYLQFALKTGILGLGILIFLFFSSILLAWKVSRLVRTQKPENEAILLGMVYGFTGLLFATASNPHLTTPVFVTSLAIIIALTDLAFREWKYNLIN